MQTVLCFGDSNTWGFDAATSQRFPQDVRWTGVLASELSAEWRVIEEGLNGRTTNLDDPVEPHRNGLSYLPACLDSHRPIDLAILMLGTNDLKARFDRRPVDIAQSAGLLGSVIRRSACGPNNGSPSVVLVAPPRALEVGVLGKLVAGAEGKSAEFPELYAFFAQRYGLLFFDASCVVQPTPLDGIHLDAAAHARLGRELARVVRNADGSA
jgi:lysophospholipase L1-like esterase